MVIEKFKQSLKTIFPNIFFYKIPDCAGLGGMRPFDGFFLIKHRNKKATFCFEAKSGKNKVTLYQKESLKRARNAGAFILVVKEDYSIPVSYITSYFFGSIKERKEAIKYFQQNP